MGQATLLARLPSRDSRPNADSLFRLGLSLSTACEAGRPDTVAAQALFELAARLGSIEAKVYRRELSDEMDPADLIEAQQAVRDWLSAG